MFPEALTTYQEAAIHSADPKALIRMLYEGALTAVEDARDCFDSGDVFERGRKVTKAVNIVDELASSLDFDASPEISGKLVALYSYIRRQLTRAHATRSRKEYTEVAGLLRNLLDGWNGACKTLDASPFAEPEEWEEPVTRGAAMAFGMEAPAPATRCWSL